ncbi:MAG: TolC family protein [Flavobacteriaceae bacterium]|nr:TolC family protein [Flavobacteriaceae bacterium]
MIKQHIHILTFCFGLFTGHIHAQEVKTISKSEVLTKVASQNLSAKISEQEYNQAKADYQQTNAVFLPNITASYTGIVTNNPLMAFGSKLNQEVLTAQDFDPSRLNDPDRVQNFTTKFEIQQPLLNLDGMFQRKAAKTKMNAMQLKSIRTQEYLTLEATKSYMELQLVYKAVEVLEKALEAAQANLKVANNSYKNGYLQKADLLSVEIRVNEIYNQLLQAKSEISNASNYVSYIMNEDDSLIFKPSDSLFVSEVIVGESLILSEERSDLKAMQLASEAYNSIYKADKYSFLPRLNAFGSYELYDDKFLQADANGYLVGAQLSWNILEGTKRFGKAQKSKAEYNKASLEYTQYLSKSKLELNKAQRMLSDAENNLKLNELSLEQAKEALRIRTNRFKEGLEKTADVLTAETSFAQKQLDYYQAVFSFNYAQAYLQFLTTK